MEVEEPLDFELDDPLISAPPPKSKRRKIIGLDDLVKDHYEETNNSLETDKKKRKSKCYSSDEDEEKAQKIKERQLSKLVDDCQKQVDEMAEEVDIPSWGLTLFGSQRKEQQLSLELKDSKILKTFKEKKIGSSLELDIGNVNIFFEGLLKNGWLLKLVHACGFMEDSIASWSFNQMLYSLSEEIRSFACDFWCGVLLLNKVHMPSFRFDWFPNYSELRSAIEIYGYHFIPHSSCSSGLVHDDSVFKGPPMNIKYWVKFVAALCQSRSCCPIFSTSEVEELLSILISLFLDRQLQGLELLLDECVRSVLSFFTEDEWSISCKKVTEFIAHRVPKDLNCLRVVECISQLNTVTKKFRSELAFTILIHCFKKQVSSAEEILKFLESVDFKEKNCDFVKLFIYLVLFENWMCSDSLLEENSDVLKMWYKYLRNCSTQITSTDWRPYASKVRNRASYLLQTRSLS